MGGNKPIGKTMVIGTVSVKKANLEKAKARLSELKKEYDNENLKNSLRNNGETESTKTNQLESEIEFNKEEITQLEKEISEDEKAEMKGFDFKGLQIEKTGVNAQDDNFTKETIKEFDKLRKEENDNKIKEDMKKILPKDFGQG